MSTPVPDRPEAAAVTAAGTPRPSGIAGSAAASSARLIRSGLLSRLAQHLESRIFPLRTGALSASARHELLIRGRTGTATVLGMRPTRGPAGPGRWHRIWVRVRCDDLPAYETRVRQQVSDADLELMQPGDVIGCRVDPGNRERLVLYVPGIAEATRVSIAKILSSGRRADATVLAAAPIAADYSGRDDPVLRLDLELRAWDEPDAWRVRIVQPVPLPAIELVDLGRHLEVAFFAVDRGESVAVDWEASAQG